MSSKKNRKKMRSSYNQKKNNTPEKAKTVEPEVDTEKIEDIVEKLFQRLKDFSVILPEISSKPIKLGTAFEVTIQIGNDQPQTKRLVYATLVVHGESYNTDLHFEGLKALMANQSGKVITALPWGKEKVSPVLYVLYPFPLGGVSMIPMAIFEWYGKEKIVISEITEYPKAYKYIRTPHYEFQKIIWSGSYVGREIDGMEVLEEEEVLV